MDYMNEFTITLTLTEAQDLRSLLQQAERELRFPVRLSCNDHNDFTAFYGRAEAQANIVSNLVKKVEKSIDLGLNIDVFKSMPSDYVPF